MGEKWKQWQILFSWSPKSLHMVTAAMKLKDDPLRKALTNLDSIHLKKQRYHFAHKSPYSQSYGFPVVMYRWESWTVKKDWAPKNWCFWTAVLEKTLETPLDSKEIKAINPKGNQLWIFIGRTNAEAEALILRPLMRRANSLEKTLMLGKIEGRRRRGWQRMIWLDGITNWMDMGFSKLGKIVQDREA